MSNIPATPADGNFRADLVSAIADPSAPKLTELDAVSTVKASCYFTKDGVAMTIDQATITDERLCSTQVFGQPGTKTFSLSLTGIDNTNTEFEATDNELVDALVEGSEWFLVLRRGKPYDEAYAVDDKVTVVPFKVGVKQAVPPEANSLIRSTWSAFITADVETDVAVVAGP